MQNQRQDTKPVTGGGQGLEITPFEPFAPPVSLPVEHHQPSRTGYDLSKIVRDAKDFWPEALVALGTFAGAVLGGSMSIYPDGVKSHQMPFLIGVFISAAVALCGGVALFRKQKRVSTLEDALQAERDKNSELTSQLVSLERKVQNLPFIYRDVVNKILTDWSKKDLQLGNSVRVSLYRHEGQHFVLMGRYALQDKFNKWSNRKHPVGEGVIGKAFDDDNYFVSDLPDPAKPERYIQSCNSRFGIDKIILAKMRMKSRCYFGRAVYNFQGTRRIAVLIIESTEPQGLDEANLKLKFNAFHQSLTEIIDFVEREPGPDETE